MNIDPNQLRVGLHNLNNRIDEILGTAKRLIKDMFSEMSVYSPPLGLQKPNDYEILLTLFGNNISVRAEVPLSKDKFMGRISCYLRDDSEDKGTWNKLDTALMFDSIGNVENDHTGFEAAHILVKTLVEEFKEKGITVKAPPIERGTMPTVEVRKS